MSLELQEFHPMFSVGMDVPITRFALVCFSFCLRRNSSLYLWSTYGENYSKYKCNYSIDLLCSTSPAFTLRLFSWLKTIIKCVVLFLSLSSIPCNLVFLAYADWTCLFFFWILLPSCLLAWSLFPTCCLTYELSIHQPFQPCIVQFICSTEFPNPILQLLTC